MCRAAARDKRLVRQWLTMEYGKPGFLGLARCTNDNNILLVLIELSVHIPTTTTTSTTIMYNNIIRHHHNNKDDDDDDYHHCYY